MNTQQKFTAKLTEDGETVLNIAFLLSTGKKPAGNDISYICHRAATQHAFCDYSDVGMGVMREQAISGHAEWVSVPAECFCITLS